MKIYFLGTNGWYNTGDGNTMCTLIDTENYYIVLDAGEGIYKLDKYLKKNKPVYLFIGHLHIDHLSGLHILGKFNFKYPLRIYSYVGSRKYLDIFKNHPFTNSFDELPYKVEIIELAEGEHKLPFTLTAKKIQHADYTLGFRFEIDGKVVAYCADTGVCETCEELSQNADILIHEASTKKPNPKPDLWGHTAPIEAAELAKKANVKKLILTHFAADTYLTLEEREEALEPAKKIFLDITAAKDGMIIEI